MFGKKNVNFKNLCSLPGQNLYKKEYNILNGTNDKTTIKLYLLPQFFLPLFNFNFNKKTTKQNKKEEHNLS